MTPMSLLAAQAQTKAASMAVVFAASGLGLWSLKFKLLRQPSVL